MSQVQDDLPVVDQEFVRRSAKALLGDDRAIFETYAAGKRVHQRDAARQHATRGAKIAA